MRTTEGLITHRDADNQHEKDILMLADKLTAGKYLRYIGFGYKFRKPSDLNWTMICSYNKDVAMIVNRAIELYQINNKPVYIYGEEGLLAVYPL